jgi:hypothetical protein
MEDRSTEGNISVVSQLMDVPERKKGLLLLSFSALISLIPLPLLPHPTVPATVTPQHRAFQQRSKAGMAAEASEDRYRSITLAIACGKVLFRVTCHVMGGSPIPNAPDVLVQSL